jgi:hypothetical protein
VPAGLSGSGWLGFAFETTKGTYVPPTTYIPIISESFRYVEDRYFSPQIRQATEVSDVKQGYYHIEGEFEMEADVNFLPYLLHCTRHTISKSAGPPYTYTFTPSTAGSTSTAASGQVQRTASITIARNNIEFGYSGCTIGTLRIFLDGGILKMGGTLIGEKDNTATGDTPTWSAPSLFGADATEIGTAASSTSPTYTAVFDFNGFEFEANFNGSAQNRIRRDRSASYVSFGETEISLTTELDFIDKTEYNNFVATAQKAIQLESIIGGANFTAATQGVRLQVFRGVYETYDLGLSGLGDLIMAGVTMRGIGIAGGTSYKLEVKSPVNIT